MRNFIILLAIIAVMGAKVWHNWYVEDRYRAAMLPKVGALPDGLITLQWAQPTAGECVLIGGAMEDGKCMVPVDDEARARSTREMQ